MYIHTHTHRDHQSTNPHGAKEVGGYEVPTSRIGVVRIMTINYVTLLVQALTHRGKSKFKNEN